MNSDSIRIFAWTAPIARDQRLTTRARSNLPVPNIVIFEENGVDAIAMDYSKLTPLLVEAVNALRAENSALQSRLDQLEQLVEQFVSSGEELKKRHDLSD